ncbi:OmpA family protein [Pseudobacteriovorax antillogorgiicola]|uniref:OmpA family protein n=1 Tax=Pseudobacteriovorax antillogorgiicola TaxID=1513793 RepID=A0A1Y6CQU0_9BACT|nr:OmpA family protein [Pseudobacteriovorax antillogorgiicola]TCS46178.1 OmpA family protein [Pseudobacteriovorax antillogorgiicola]SMF70025.1 OmpA family protein [Pseudobacteriovorax antillogorgiicola]
MIDLLKPLNVRRNAILAILIAVSTNHSLGEIVYKNQTNSAPSAQENQATPLAPRGKMPHIITVLDIIGEGQDQYVSLASHGHETPTKGAVLDIYRRKGTQIIHVGVVKVSESTSDHTVAHVVQNGTQESRILEKDYPLIMIGDRAVLRDIKIARVIQITPNKTLSFFGLFQDPQAYPQTFELSAEGKRILTAAARVFQASKLPTLLVEGHTNAEGAADVNQVESYQRALTVRQFLINELGFDPDRVVAIGMGEIEPVSEPYLPNHVENARRIVLKAKAF